MVTVNLLGCAAAANQIYVGQLGQLGCKTQGPFAPSPPSPPAPGSTVTGTVVVYHSHSVRNNTAAEDGTPVESLGTSQTAYTAIFTSQETGDETRARFTLGAAGEAPDVVTGDRVTFTVRQGSSRGRLLLDSPVFCDPNSDLCLDSETAVSNQTSTGEKDFVVDGKPLNITSMIMLATVCGVRPPISMTALRGTLFNANQNAATTKVTLQHYYSTCTFGKLSYLPENSLITEVSLPCTGLYQTLANGKKIMYDSVNSCDDPEWTGWTRDSLAAAQTALGVLDFSNYKRRVTFLAWRPACPWAGVANVGCQYTCDTLINQDTPSVYLSGLFHELGHNIGLHHANRWNNGVNEEYGDFTDPMGMGDPVNDPYQNKSMVCLSAPQAYKAGWVTPAFNFSVVGGSFSPGVPTVIAVPSMHLTDRSFAYVNISYLSDFLPSWPSAAGGVPRSNQLFISYRVKQPMLGYDSGLADELSRKVYLHSYNATYRVPPRPDPDSTEMTTSLIAILALKAGSVSGGLMKVDTQFRFNYGSLPGVRGTVNGLNIRPLSLNATHAVLSVCYFRALSEADVDNGCNNGPTTSTTSKVTAAAAKALAAKPTNAKFPAVTAAEPTAAEPTASKGPCAKPTATKPTATKPTATKPTAAEPTATKPTATKPTATKPTATKPTATKPTAAEPTATEPTAAKPTATTATKLTATTAAKPTATKPTATKTGITTTDKSPAAPA
ncbi:Autolysin [Tetrabaena socialis]|uniref:Autolysin n=1 Tax=Tetrabaena socialis TaxID=47790 RepID=A0A2J8AB79_9CHLO|nr:Autolysin [Tetrabaena socialis]|eukprot:PNH09771.1 Autolysin [Tetrabaena socialis]